MSPRCCHACGQPLPEQAAASPVDELRAWCTGRGWWVGPRDQVDERTAAQILGRAEGTLRNWRSYGDGQLPFRTDRGKRVTYLLADLAAFQAGEK